MTDKVKIEVDANSFKITNLQTGLAIFDTAYNYIFHQDGGSIVFPCTATMSGMNGNLTFQLNGYQVVITNPYFGNSNPVTFDTYMIAYRSLNETVNASAFTQVNISNVELPSVEGGPDPSMAAGSDSAGGDGSTGDAADGEGEGEGAEGEGDGDGGGDGGDGGEGGGDGGEG